MANITTLKDDIYEVASNGVAKAYQNEESDKVLVEFATRMGEFMGKKVYAEDKGKKDPLDLTIRMSELGTPCFRQLLSKWFIPEYGREPYTYKPDPALGLKFGYGNMVEEYVLTLAELSGHEVRDKQRKVEIPILGSTWTLTGSIDAIIDDVVVDVKSSSKFGFDKYKREGFTELNDSFGYSWQLQGYKFATRMADVKNYDAAFLMVEKETGRIELIEPRPINMAQVLDRGKLIGNSVETFAKTGALPARLPTLGHPMGTKLDVVCSYCNFKHACFKKLHTFVDKKTPVHLVTLNERGEKFVKSNPKEIWQDPPAKIPA